MSAFPASPQPSAFPASPQPSAFPASPQPSASPVSPRHSVSPSSGTLPSSSSPSVSSCALRGLSSSSSALSRPPFSSFPASPAFSRRCMLTESEMGKTRSLKWLRFRCILGACLLHFCLGGSHTIGNLLPYLIGFIRNAQATSAVSYKDGLSIYAWAIICQGVGGFLGTTLEKKAGTKKTAFLGSAWMTLGLALCGVCTHDLSLFLIAYGVVTALGCGVAYPVPLAATLKLSPAEDKGWVSGLLFFARGLSVCILCPFQSFFLHQPPEVFLSLIPAPLLPYLSGVASDTASASRLSSLNGKRAAPLPSPGGERFLTDQAVLDRLPALFFVMAGVFACIQLLGVLLLVDPERTSAADEAAADAAERQKLLYEDPQGASRASAGRSSSCSASQVFASLVLTPQDMCSSPSFWRLFLMLLLSWQSLFFVQLFWKVLPLYPEASLAASAAAPAPLDSLFASVVRRVPRALASASRPDPRALHAAADAWSLTGSSWSFANDFFLSCLGGLLGALCCFGRLLWGYIGGGIGYMRSTVVMNALTAPCLFALSTYALQSPQLYAACLALVHVCHGGIFSLFPSVTSDLFGHKNVGPVFSLLFAARLAAVALAAIWINIALTYGNLHMVVGALGVCHLVSIGTTFFFHPTDALPYRFPTYSP
ncbi:transporter, major facilitator family protein [Toxoplasma gondii ME49]|uniref:Transporter, major facilitator family protein n=1 Tax=Toxoplasma gondii (strain ATCC 50611 / Me49) TaxID=508771 RepID=S8FEC1_TOXGM|nr:transporter, major facilitator family protein [Toxoplasma gondii ME49]EPT32143.1 transporter, major facilitator family protein [Toxoplasma gondii ME49]|eukprot:XP_018638348.1 transporter, major facilitator family protein [Toxoplasma gondii ME49]